MRGAIATATANLVIGITLGLIITWGLLPVGFTNADPSDLRQTVKLDYVRMISLTYERTGDLVAAQRQLATLQLDNPTLTFNQLVAQEKSASHMISQDALIHLAQGLGLKVDYTASSPAPLPVGAQTIVAIPVTPTPAVLTFKVVESAQLSCADEPDAAHLRIVVRDAAGRDLPNIGIQIRSADTDETIFTGLKPERGEGYADLEVTPNTYTLTILNAQADSVSNLVVGDAPANCKADRGTTPRGWKIVFQQS